ncbi:MAG: DUF2269 domain-containing protein [Gammaproteobacteria bacterium]|nr:DUF2269 domain-containing protein [Gammaproteobacteria bacterium]
MIRLLHVISSALMFGVGVGAFWFMLTTVRSGDTAAIAVTTRNAVRAEWFIAAPVALVQPVTGYVLMLQLGYPLRSTWFFAVATLYIVAGMCWVYLIKTELKLRDLAAEHGGEGALPASFGLLFRRWTRLAVGSFAGVLAIFWLMVFRPGLAA